MKYHIDARALLNVLPFRSTDETRYNSNTVQIRAGRAWAMNRHLAIGHRLEQIKDEDLIGGEGRLQDVTLLLNVTRENVKPLTTLLKDIVKQKYGKHFVIYDDKTGCIHDMTATTVLTLGLPDGEYPDLLKVIPKPDTLRPLTCYQLSSNYLAQLAKLAGGGGLMIYNSGENSPYVITPSSDDWLAILMPMNLAGKGVDVDVIAQGAERLAAVHSDMEAVYMSESKKKPTK